MLRRTPLLLATAIVIGALGVGSPAEGRGAAVPAPGSMGAIGDSFSVGYGACTPFASCADVSWTTGTGIDHPDFESHLTRLEALEPALAGNATNVAAPGSGIDAMPGQVAALAPSAPDYVTVLIGAADACRSDVALMTPVADFRTSFRAGLTALRAQIPEARVLVVGIPDLVSIFEAVRHRPGIETGFFAGYCATVYADAASDDRAARQRRSFVRNRIHRYNEAMRAECARDRLCRSDGGALFRHRWTDDEVSADFLHPSIAGQQVMADVTFAAGWRWAS